MHLLFWSNCKSFLPIFGLGTIQKGRPQSGGGLPKMDKIGRMRWGQAKVDVLFTHAQKSLKASPIIQIMPTSIKSCLNGGYVQQNLFTVDLRVITWKKKRRRELLHSSYPSENHACFQAQIIELLVTLTMEGELCWGIAWSILGGVIHHVTAVFL